MTFDMSQTVSAIAIENPAAVRVFDKFGMDYCCAGKRSLQEACERASAPIDQVLQALSELRANGPSLEEQPWTTRSFEANGVHRRPPPSLHSG